MLKNKLNDAIVLCSNGVIAAWHPKRAFPYEHTRAIDLKKVDEERELLYKKLTDKSRYNTPPLGKKGPGLIDLREIFYTSTQTFRPRNRETRLYQMSAPLPKRK